MAIIAVFIGGLMIGRTPEYLGKKIQKREVQLAGIGILVMPITVLVITGIAVSVHAGQAAPLNSGPHGFTEILYAFTSQGNNNGSAFGGLTGNTDFYNVMGGVAMLLGRFGVAIPALALAGSLAAQAGRPRRARDVPDRQHDVRRAAARRDRHRRRPHVLPRGRARPRRRAAQPRKVLVDDRDRRPPRRRRTARARRRGAKGLFDRAILRQALVDSFKKLDPRVQVHNPVMFVVYVGTIVCACYAVEPAGTFMVSITIWLALTVLFANFAEAMAEGRGKAQADSLRRLRTETAARRLNPDGTETVIAAAELRKGDLVVCEAGDVIPSDGEIIEGVASVDESAITGESAPVIRESGGDRSAVTGGTTVLSDRIVVEITAERGETFLDRMIALVEGADRQKTPNEIALTILLAVLTIVFLPVVVSLQPFAGFAGDLGQRRDPGLAARLPHPDDDRRAAERDRHRGHGPARAAQRARDERPRGRGRRRRPDPAARQDRDDHARQPDGVEVRPGRRRTPSRTSPTSPSSPRSPTRRPRAARSSCSPRSGSTSASATSAPTTTSCRSPRRRGCPGSTWAAARSARARPTRSRAWVEGLGGTIPAELEATVDGIARSGSTPLVVADGTDVVGVVELKDIVKQGIAERFAEMRMMGIRTVMITGDNPLTAAAIAQEAGVDDFLAEATPEAKMRLIRQEQEGGKLVAMTGDGTNDAPALAQADVGVAMNSGTTAAKEAGNMVDLDSNPTKLIDVVEIGKQLLITRAR